MFKRSASKLSVPFISLSTAQHRQEELPTAQNLILAKKSALIPAPADTRREQQAGVFLYSVYIQQVFWG